MRNRYLIGAGVALATVMTMADARAQLFGSWGPPVWYFGAEGGWTSLDTQTGRIGGGVFGPIRERYQDGYNVGARVGAEFGPWRLEEEFRHQQNDMGRITVPAAGFDGRLNGDRRANAFMTNLIYDLSNWSFGGFSPHIGGGLGAIELRDSGSIPPAGPTVLGPSTRWEFGYQAIGGVRYNINPALAFDVDYRYLASMDNSRFRTNINAGFGGARYTSGYETHSVVASLSVKFGAPPPPPPAAAPLPPAPPPVARRVFLVFFDWDRDTITPDGMAIIHQAADAFRSGAPVQIMVTGYADRSGSPGYNQRLSERRANNVANALVRLGVPRQQMAVSGRGENDNRVPTADGVREPQNRRVEIVFP